ncbi:DUF6527 family protein [Marivita sp.]|uniref:DUF6527 family protein n=1 Tax=Marivita sp. TaxID=2003365 RepID=UPI003F700811
MTLRAILYLDRTKHFEAQTPGSVWLSEDPAKERLRTMLFWCPCGCGYLARITVGEEHKPITGPSWNWNGNAENPTLRPSINQKPCGWHGWLTDGYWSAC